MSGRVGVAAAAGAAAVLVAGLGIGRVTREPTQTGARPGTVAVDCAGQGPALAAAEAVVALNGRRALDPASRGEVLTRWVAEDSRSRLAARLAVGDELAAGLLNDLAAGRPAVTLVVPIAARVDACTDDRASVRVWTMAMLGTARLGRLDAAWSTETLQLVRERNGWRVEDFASSSGPVPVVAQPATPVDTVLDAAAGMTGLSHAYPH